MEQVLLKSRIGVHEFTRRTKTEHERGMTYEKKTYRFNFDNDFKCLVPKDVWESLEHEWVDRTARLRYKDAYIEL